MIFTPKFVFYKALELIRKLGRLLDMITTAMTMIIMIILLFKKPPLKRRWINL